MRGCQYQTEPILERAELGNLCIVGQLPGCQGGRERPPSGQSEDDGVQGQPHGCPHDRAIDADVLQIAPEEQF